MPRLDASNARTARYFPVAREGWRSMTRTDNPPRGATILAHGTWLEPEERCYPSGAMLRRGRAVMPDGAVRAVRAGIADTYFSIPAYARIAGKYVRGYLTAATASGLSTPTADDPAYWEFRPVWRRCASRYAGATLNGRAVRCEGRIDPATGECSSVTRDGRHGHSFAARYWAGGAA